MSEKFRDLKRFEEIIFVLAKHELGFISEKLKLGKNKLNHPQKNLNPERVRKVLEELGGTFVKLGQLLSLRPDLVTEEYAEAFSELQDSVKPFPAKKVKGVIQGELKDSINNIFRKFSLKPIASASIGQVHEATLKSGEKIAVKIMRPDIKKAMEADIDIIFFLAQLVEKHFKPKIFSPVQVVSEFQEYTEKELNYVKETRNIEKFHNNFKDTKVKIPKVYQEYCTEKVIVMEFVEGIEVKKIIEGAKGYDRKTIANKLANTMFKQVFNDGFFHGDPHPGNILATKNNEIAFLDFGIVGKVNQEMKEKLTRLFIALIQKNIDKVADELLNLGIITNEIDIDNFKDELSETLGKYYDTAISSLNISELIAQGIKIARKNKVKLPQNFVVLGKAIATMEGTCAELDPGFNIVAAAKPFVGKALKEQMNVSHIIKDMISKSYEIKKFIEDFPEMSRKAYSTVEYADQRLKRIDQDIEGIRKEMGRSSSKIVFAFTAGCLIIASAMLANIPQATFQGFPVYTLTGILIGILLLFVAMVVWLRQKG